MTFTKIAAAAAIALATAGAPVPAQSAAPLSVAASVQRSGADTAHANRLWNDYWVPLGIFAAVIIAIIVLNNKSNGDLPRSP
jgi:hypothetical protein